MVYNKFNIANDGTFGYKQIKSVGSGRLPPSLKGMYTTTTAAKVAIDTYIGKKGRDNDTTTGTSRGK